MGAVKFSEEEYKRKEEHDKEIEKEKKEREAKKICYRKAFNIWVLRELWKKYNGTYTGFYENICKEPTYRRIMKFEKERYDNKKLEKDYGIPKKYMVGEQYIRIANNSDIEQVCEQFVIIRDINRQLKAIYSTKTSEEERKAKIDELVDVILPSVDIEDEYDDLVAAMEDIKSEFLSKYKKHKNEKMKGTYNDYLANMIDVIAGRKEEITIKLRVHDIEKFKDKVSECVNTIIEMCEEAENLESEIMEILNRLELENIQKNSDMYKILYFMKYKKKYD